MEISLLGLIAIGLGTMFFGYFFGLAEGRGQGYKKRSQEEAVGQQPAVPLEAPAGVPAPGPTPAKALLVLTLSEAGRPLLRVDDREIDSLRVSADQRRRLIDLMVMMRPWVEPPGGASTESPVPAKPAPASKMSSMLSGRSALPVAAAPTPAAPPAPTGPMSLVTQIDSILQAQLEGTAFANRGIRLAESLHGGAIVFIGTKQYDGVDQVPDPEVQAVIRAAIAEWERKATPG